MKKGLSRQYDGDMSKIILDDDADKTTSLSLCELDITQFEDGDTLQALVNLVSRMPNVEELSLFFNLKKAQQNLGKINDTIQQLIGVVLSECTKLKALTIDNCFIQMWDEKTWSALEEFLNNSQITHLNIARLNLAVSDDVKKLDALFKHTVSAQSVELCLDSLKDKHADIIFECVKKYPNISQLVIHSKLKEVQDPIEFCNTILDGDESSVKVIRLLNDEEDVTPEEVIQKSNEKIGTLVKLITEGKGKSAREEAVAELEQLISSLCTPYSSAQMLSCQIEYLITLFQDLDKTNENTNYLEGFISTLCQWFKSGLIAPDTHLDLLDFQKWPATFESYISLLSVMTIDLYDEDVRAQWGLDVKGQVFEKFHQLGDLTHSREVGSKKLLEDTTDQFMQMIEKDIFKRILTDAGQKALLLICVSLKVSHGNSPVQFLESMIESNIQEFEKDVNLQGLVDFLKVVHKNSNADMFENVVKLLVTKLQYPLMLAKVSECISINSKDQNSQFLSLVILQHAKNKGFTDEDEVFEQQLKEYVGEFMLPEQEEDEDDISSDIWDPFGDAGEDEGEEDAAGFSLEEIRQEIKDAATRFLISNHQAQSGDLSEELSFRSALKCLSVEDEFNSSAPTTSTEEEDENEDMQEILSELDDITEEGDSLEDKGKKGFLDYESSGSVSSNPSRVTFKKEDKDSEQSVELSTSNSEIF